MFKRRSPLTWLQLMRESFYPRAGWRRASQYLAHRVKRLPDSPQRVAFGLSIGVFISFTPLFGFHFFVSAFIAWILRGNVLAALIGTFFGNPLTFPIIGTIALWFGREVLGFGHVGADGEFSVVAKAFGNAFLGLWQTMKSFVSDTPPAWDLLGEFFVELFIPYFLGGLFPGLIAALICYLVSVPLVDAYQRRRREKLRKRAARHRERKAEALRAARTEET